MKCLLHIWPLWAATLLLFLSCGPDGQNFRIKGRFRDMPTGELYIYNLSGDGARLDTVTVQEGKFQYKGQTEEVTPYMLVFPNGVEQVIFVGPGEDLEYEASANDLKNYVVKGMEENELLNQFREETYTMNPSSTTTVARTYIKDHAASPVAIYLLETYFVQNDDASNEETGELLKVVKAKHPHHHYLLDVESKLAAVGRRQEGQILPDVTLVKKDMTTVKLWATKKDYNLIVFWSIWMPMGNDVLWRMRRFNEKYDTSSQLRMVAISLDIERDRWEDAVRQDSLQPIEHYCDGRNFESKALKTLGVTSVPYYILTDKNQKVLDSGDDVGQMEEMLKRHLKK